MKIKRITQVLLCMLLVCCIALPTVACNKTKKYDNETSAFVVATQELDQMFNPFFATSGYDTSVVGMTQISMLSSDENGAVYVGEDHPTVVKYYSIYQYDNRTDEEKSPDFVGRANINNYYTQYRFVLKNGIKFSDGTSLTIKDVLFNLYLYLDPAYTGSNTLYSTDIYGLDSYRSQVDSEEDGASASEQATQSASAEARERIENLIAYYSRPDSEHRGEILGDGETSENRERIRKDFEIVKDTFKDELYTDWNGASSVVEDSKKTYTTPGELISGSKKVNATRYKSKVTSADGKVATDKEVTTDYEWLTEDWQLFLINEGAVQTYWDDDDKDVCVGVDYANFTDMVNKFKSNKSEAVSQYIENGLGLTNDQISEYREKFNNFEELKDFLACLVFNSKLGGQITDNGESPEDNIPANICTNIDQILYYWVTGTTIRQTFTAEALTKYFSDKKTADGGLLVPSVKGITVSNLKPGDVFKTGTTEVDLTTGNGEPKETNVESINIDENYEVLEIKIYGVDPKAIWNFGFTVAPMHYYSDPTIANDIDGNTGFTAADGYEGYNPDKGHYGFPFANADYFTKVIKSRLVPMGAGTYKASTATNYDGNIVVKENGRWVERIQKKSTSNGFFGDQIVYYTRNNFFVTTGDEIENARIKLFRYQVVSSNRLYDAVKTGLVHYADPSATENTIKEASNDKDKGIASRLQDNLGYGYIGINPKYVRDIVVRRCIMMAMDVNMCLNFYPDSASIIYRPMTNNCWAYPKDAEPFYITSDMMTGGYPTGKLNNDVAMQKISKILADAGYTKKNGVLSKNLKGNVNEFKLKFTFTVAGGDSDHPAYATMSNAVDILNACGFDCKLVNDAQALSKLASGTLQVWAAAWSSAIDPDMYQVYHKESKATSTLNWGYDEILGLNGKTAVDYSKEDAPVGLWSDIDGNKPLNADYERELIDTLSDLIDDARATTDGGREGSARALIYKDALDVVMKLAVELPTYQRKNLYVFRSDIIDESTTNTMINAYQGPIDKVWLVSFVNN